MSSLIPWSRRSLTNWRSADPFVTLKREMDALFDSFFQDEEMVPAWGNGFMPRVNVAEDAASFAVEVEVPGMAPEAINVSLTDNALVISGEKSAEHEEKDEARNYVRRERSYGSFRREIPLPVRQLDADNIDATFKNGVLTVTLPKLEGAVDTMKRIPVNAG